MTTVNSFITLFYFDVVLNLCSHFFISCNLCTFSPVLLSEETCPVCLMRFMMGIHEKLLSLAPPSGESLYYTAAVLSDERGYKLVIKFS